MTGVFRPLTAAALLAAFTLVMTGCAQPGGVQVDPNMDKPFVLTGVSEVTEIAQLTGPGAINDTEPVAVAGTDLGSMTTIGDKTFFFFGDTFGTRDPNSIGGQGDFWRSNVSAWTTDDDPSDGITFDGWVTDSLGLAVALIEGDHRGNNAGAEVTKIPTHGFVVEETIYVSYMSVRHWGEPGAWDANFSALIRSTDLGQTWEPVENVQWPGESNFIQWAALEVMDASRKYIYIWAIPAGRFGGVALMRVPATVSAVESQDAYEYFAGTQGEAPRWSSNMADAELVIPPTIGEMSVIWSTYLERWIMTYSDIGNAYIREGITPWGPWGQPIEMISRKDYPGLYSPYMEPRYVSDEGRRIYFTLSLWGPYNVFWFSADFDRE